LKQFSVFLLSAVCSCAQTAPPLGTAANFAVLGGSTVTNTGNSVIVGSVGVSPGTAITGFPPGTVSGGAQHAGDAAATQAQTDLAAAYSVAFGEAPTQVLTGQDLGGLTLTPGVYRFSNAAQLTGILTLNGLGNANPIFVFQIGSTLNTASGASMVAENGAQAANIFWQVGSSATLGSGSFFIGNILASASITPNAGASVAGRLLAINGAVTLINNAVNYPPSLAPGSPGGPPLGPSPTPAPSSWMLLVIGLFCAMLYRTRAQWLGAIKLASRD
jgi:type VI secretion system secreted protein VgrG